MGTSNYLYPLYAIEDRRDFREMLDRTCERFGGEKTFFEKIEGEDYKGITYDEFRDAVRCFGEGLLDHGIRERETVGIIGKNCRKWAIAYYAVTTSNFVAVPIDKDLGEAEIERILEKAGVRAVIFENKFREPLKRIRRRGRTVAFLIPFEPEKDLSPDMDRLIERGREIRHSRGKGRGAGMSAYESVAIDPNELTAVIFTSGTTGNPKGVMLSQRNIISNIVQMRQLIWIDETMTFLSVLPLHHVYECTCGFLCQVHAGTKIAYAQSLKKIPENLAETKATNVNVVPLLLEAFCKRIREKIEGDPRTRIKFRIGDLICTLAEAMPLPGRKGRDGGVRDSGQTGAVIARERVGIRRKVFHEVHEKFGGKLDMFISGGAAVKPEVSRFMRKLGFRVLQGYGITECSPFLAGNRDRAFRDAAAGLPSPGCDVRIFDRNEAGIGEIGAKGPNVMLGYYRDPELTAQAFRDGYFMTGDSGTFDRGGFLRISGRKKDVIVTKTGKNVYPEEIEFLFTDTPHIQEIVVAARRHPETSDEVIAAHVFPNFETLAAKIGADRDRIQDSQIIPLVREDIRCVNAKLVSYRRIKYFSLQREEFVKTTTRKVKRFAVKTEGALLPVYR